MNLKTLNSILTRVNKPSQYLGNEVNSIHKDFDKAKVKVALVFPDKYEMGMSHVGLKILYDILNQLPDVVAERCFAPELDMEAALRKENLPLFSLESKRPLKDFDIVGISFTYELTYTNALNIIDLGGIPVWQKDRLDGHPLIIGGGGCMMNAEPIADFLDAAALGDGEELILDIVNAVRNFKNNSDQNGVAASHKSQRQTLLESLSQIEGIYIPSFFKPEYHGDGTLKQIIPLLEGYERVQKRTLKNLDKAPYPTALVVPSVKLIHDRIGIEIQRGCNRACRFCQAGYIDRPVRQRSPQNVLDIAEESLKKTGIEDISLLSLSAADYDCLVPLLKELNGRYSDQKVAISVPATRTEKLTPDLLEQIKKVRKSGFTVAPEAGTERMRRVINKGNKVDDLYTAVTNAFSAGWELLKLYYMVGLPYETDEDVLGIAHEGNESIKICLKYTGRSELNLSVSSFVPKPHTPFQWEPQMTLEETKRRYALVRNNLKSKRIRFKHHHPEMSHIEGLFSRGDRRISEALYIAFKQGCRFDEWEEHFDFPKWQEVLKTWGGDVDFYLHRRRLPDEILPWDHLFAQMDKKFLWEELEKAHAAAFTEDCSIQKCSDCGVCDFKIIKNRIFVKGEQEIMVKKGNREWYGWDPEYSKKNRPAHTILTDLDKLSEKISLKIRFRFTKSGVARFMGHLELMGAIKRAIKRAHLPIGYSEGFHPQMKISMSHPLSVGIESDWEFFDLDLFHQRDPGEIKDILNQILPGGLKILSAELIDRGTPSLYSSLKEIFYSASYENDQESQWPLKALEALERFNQSQEFMWLREGKRGVKHFNLRDTVVIDLKTFPQAFNFRTKIDPEGSIKPQEVLKALFGFSDEDLSRISLKKVGLSWGNSQPIVENRQNLPS